MSALTIGIITLQLQEGLPTQVVSCELTERQREVLAFVARGCTNKQIAEALYITEKTARNHVSHILEKLELSCRTQAAVFAIEHRLIPPRMRQSGETP